MDVMQRLKSQKPAHFSGVVSRALARLAAQHPGASADPVPSARAYVAYSIPFGGARTLGYLAWGLAHAWDELHAGRRDDALATLSLLLVSVEQAALDESSWGLAWFLTLLPEPPWPTMSRRPDANALRPYSKLADTRWVAAGLAFMRDVDRIKAARKEHRDVTSEPPAVTPGKGKGKDKEKGGKGMGAAAPPQV